MSASAKVQAYRERMRAAGYRPVQYWVPDTRSPAYRARLQRQIQALLNDPAEKEAIEWAEAVGSSIEGWE